MTVAVLLPHVVGAFFIKWFLPLPQIPEHFDGEFISKCQLMFRFYPTRKEVKRIERNHWFWWSGMVVTMIVGWYSDNRIIALVHIFTLCCMVFSILAFSWTMLRHIRFVNWLNKISGHTDFLETMLYVAKNIPRYAECSPQMRDRIDAMSYFITQHSNCISATFK